MAGVVLVVAFVFVALVVAIEGLHHDANRRHRYVQALVTTNELERYVVDLETGLRGFLLTRQQPFLGPYRQALGQIPAQLSALRGELAGDRGLSQAAVRLSRAIGSYERGYLKPLVSSGTTISQARIAASTDEGKRLLDGIRAQFVRLEASEGKLAQEGAAATSSSARYAIFVASAGFLATVLVLGGLAILLQRLILTPVGLVADAAARMRAEQRGVRVPPAGRGEIGSLAQSFNEMSGALEDRDRALTTARDRLQGVLDHAGAVIYIKDSRGRYLLVNQAFLDVRDLRLERVLGHTEEDFSAPEVAAQIAADDRAVVETGESLSNEYTVETVDGLRTFLSVNFPIPTPEGDATIGGVSTDITEQKRAL